MVHLFLRKPKVPYLPLLDYTRKKADTTQTRQLKIGSNVPDIDKRTLAQQSTHCYSDQILQEFRL